MNVLKRKDFARWQARERLPDTSLCQAVEEMEDGLSKVFLDLPPPDLSKAIEAGVLMEVHCAQ